MKIALIGYGKMGKAIEEIALSRGHEIIKRIDVDNQHEFIAPVIQVADVAIEFTSPQTAFKNVKKSIDAFGWSERGTVAFRAHIPSRRRAGA